MLFLNPPSFAGVGGLYGELVRNRSFMESSTAPSWWTTVAGTASIDATTPLNDKLTRTLDERIWTLTQQGKVAITGPCQGHEAAQVASVLALRPGHDVFYPYYRDVGVALALGLSPRDVLLGSLDRATDPCSGARQMPYHYTSVGLKLPTPQGSAWSSVIQACLPAAAASAAMACASPAHFARAALTRRSLPRRHVIRG